MSKVEIDRAALARLRQEPLRPGSKGLPLDNSRVLTVETVAEAGWSVRDADLPMPVMTLDESALVENIETMAAYCRSKNILLAPHGKTTMAPQIFERQINAGCWAISAATPAHLRTYRAFGINRIFYANQLVEPAVIRWLARELDDDPALDFYCLVDSVEGVARMASALSAAQARRPLKVLIEVGHAGGRTGCRTVADVTTVARAVAESSRLRLVGIEAYEGTIGLSLNGDDDPDAISERLASFLDTVARSLDALVAAGQLADDGDTIISAGGSAFFDQVIDAFGSPPPELPSLRLVLRSGCYVVHDGGYYEAHSPFGSRGSMGGPRLKPALEVWSVVLSRPEEGLVIIGAGKRDLPTDLGLPVPTRRWSERHGLSSIPPGSAEVQGVSDQHLHLRVDPAFALDVGDLCACTISHPCTAFDKWQVIPVVDSDLTVIDALRTYF